jgi:formate dehydrogenase major subunit
VADVVLPGTASWCESEGTVTSSERRVQRVRKAIEPPEGARDDIWIIGELAKRLGYDWGDPSAEDLWEELRELSPMHRGMSYEKLERLGGVQWPCPDDESEGTLFLHARLWEEDPARRGAPAPFFPVEQDDPLDTLTDEYPVRLTTGRRLDSYNTGVATNQFTTPLRRPETLNLSPEDAANLSLADGAIARITSRRGSITAPVLVDETLREGLAFMTLHFPDQVEINILTLDTWDPKSGTAEFKATAIRVEQASPEETAATLERLRTAEVSS